MRGGEAFVLISTRSSSFVQKLEDTKHKKSFVSKVRKNIRIQSKNIFIHTLLTRVTFKNLYRQLHSTTNEIIQKELWEQS